MLPSDIYPAATPDQSPASACCSARPEAFISIIRLVRQLAFATAAAGTVYYTASQVRPVFLGRASVADRMLAGAYLDTTATSRAPWLSLPEALAMKHPQYRRDIAAFAADLRGTGQIDDARADSIARVAVREAYHRRVPPALVLGVMLTENDAFKRSARSKVGALGLMQVMPRLWTPNLGHILGRNLKDDETNLRYGVYILKHFARSTSDTLDPAAATRTALLRYNGCVRGTNTPDCRAYPEKVRRHVENDARNVCAGRGYHDCVAVPLWAALRDTLSPHLPASTAAKDNVPAAATDRVRPAPRRVARAERMGNYLLGLVSPRTE